MFTMSCRGSTSLSFRSPELKGIALKFGIVHKNKRIGWYNIYNNMKTFYSNVRVVMQLEVSFYNT